MARSFSSYINTRARIQRLKDAKFLSGWVNEFDGSEVKIKLSAVGGCDPGDRCLVEIYGEGSIATFQASVSAAYENHAHLTVYPPVHYKQSTENPRFCVTGVVGVVLHEEAEHDCKVTDISRNGAGLVLRKQIARKEIVKIKMITPVGPIDCEGEVRYCRLDPAGNGSYRIGVQLKELGRLEKARWTRLFEEELVA